MKGIYRFLFLCQLVFVSIQSVHSVKAYPYPVQISQPDGSTLTIKLHGDEFRHFTTTEDGYLIKQNSAGLYSYATIDATGLIRESNILAKDAIKRTVDDLRLLQSIGKPDVNMLLQKTAPSRAPSDKDATKMQRSYPLSGTPKSLVILVNYTDVSFTSGTANADFTNLLNQAGYSANGGTGSARDYFKSASYGQFNPQFDVVGPYTLPNNRDYYGANSGGFDIRPRQMVIDACNAANADVDFSQYDTDSDGFVDNIFVYYAGHNEAEHGGVNTIWPHKWSLANYSTVIDGKIIFEYACTSELRGSSGTNMCGIGTFTHEFGHVVGLPDYYHTDVPEKNTLNYWSIMDIGAYSNLGRTPPSYSAYDRFYLGWLTPQQVSSAANLTLLPLYQGLTPPVNTNNQAFLFSATTHDLNGDNPSPKEFFMVEYRKKTGWDTYLPGEGMLIWHIDYDQTAWNNNGPNNYTGTEQTPSSHMRVYLQPLIGSTTTPGAAFTTGSFTPTTWAGVDMNRPITNITVTADNIKFKLMGGLPDPVIQPGEISNQTYFAGSTVNTTKSKTLNIKTTDLTGSLTLTITGDNANLFTVNPDTITKEAANAAGGANITLNYTPTTTGNHTAVLTISGGGLNPAKVINLSGSGL